MSQRTVPTPPIGLAASPRTSGPLMTIEEVAETSAPSKPFNLPLRLTVEEFARIARVCPETVRRDIRARKIKAKGRPYLIPCGELLKVDISPGEVTEAHFYGLAAA